MKPQQIAITGREMIADGNLPERALSDFYRAFNDRDLGAMAENWSQSDEASMDNPLGGIKRGWEEIRAVYERLFGGPARVREILRLYAAPERGFLPCRGP